MKKKSLSEKSPSVLINSHTLKVEKENALAMVEGFWKDNQLYYVTIFTAHRRATSLRNDFRQTPKLLTTKNYPPRPEYPLSEIGKALQRRNYQHATQYLAILDTIYHIENDIRLWNVLCADGTFDIWHPKAPFNSLDGKTDPMILLLRIYQIDDDFSGELIDKYYSHVVEPREVCLLEPVLPNDEFRDLKKELKFSLEDWLSKEQPIYDTCRQAYADFDVLESDQGDEVYEGKERIRKHKYRERRTSGLVRLKKSQAKQKLGRLACEICGFVPREYYGHLGDSVIECHHIVPISKLQGNRPTRLEDLALVCADCHRMLHRGGETLTIEGLTEMIERTNQEAT